MSGEEFDELNQARANRAGAWVVLFVAVASLGLGLWQLHSKIVQAVPVSEYKTLEEQDQEKLDALKSKDTDGDGLSDFDETYVYKTSPYLTDSDSDGVSDKDELAKGTDPNCPEGQACGPLGNAAAAPAAQTETTTSTDADAKALESLMNPTPAQVRQYLKDSGVKDEDLAQVDDATLMNLYRESLLEAQLKNANAQTTQ